MSIKRSVHIIFLMDVHLNSLLRLLVLVVLISATRAQAQVENVKAAWDTMHIEKFDSLKQIRKLEKAQALEKKVSSKVDTAREFSQNVNGKIQSATQKINSFDNINPSTLLHLPDSSKRNVQKRAAKLDSQEIRFTHKIDSLKKLGVPHEKNSKALDSLEKLNPLNGLEKTKSKVAEAQSTVHEKINAQENKVNGKLSLLSNEAEGQGNLPDNVKVPGVDQKELLKDLPSTDLKAPNLENPIEGKIDTKNIAGDFDKDIKSELDGVKDELGKDLNNVKGNVSKKMEDLNPSDKVDRLQSSEEIKKLKEGTVKIQDASDKVSGYAEDAKNIKEGKIEKVETLKKDVTDELKDRVPMGEFDEAQKQLGAMNGEMEKLKALKNKEAFKKQTLARGKEMVMQQLASQHQEIKETVSKISDYQKKGSGLMKKVKGLPSRPKKSAKPPFTERFVPGLTIQVQKSTLWLTDLNPSLRFRVRSILSIGSGWNERIAVDHSAKIIMNQRVYGVRNFVEFSIRKGLSMKADVERMNAFVPNSFFQPDMDRRKWMWNYFIGLRKDFSLGDGAMGNVQFMYNLYDPKHQSPYLSRLNVRFGFEFPLKKSKKKH
jgi:hypothetical protein